MADSSGESLNGREKNADIFHMKSQADTVLVFVVTVAFSFLKG